MRVLVTGGTGFLGAHLCEALLARGEEVVALDNLATSNGDALERLARYSRFTFIKGDVCAHPPVGCIACHRPPGLPLPHRTNTCGFRSRHWLSVATEAISCYAWPGKIAAVSYSLPQARSTAIHLNDRSERITGETLIR